MWTRKIAGRRASTPLTSFQDSLFTWSSRSPLSTARREVPHSDRGPAERAAGAIASPRGDTLILTRSSEPGRPSQYDAPGRLLSPAVIGVAQPEFLDHVLVGENIKLDDGRIGGLIRAIAPDKIVVEIVQARAKGSVLRAEKGINLPESELRVSPLTEDDIEALEFVARHADLLGYSFVRTESDIRDLQARLDKLGGKQPGIILKIETREAFEQLPSLMLTAMRSPRIGVMIARGDLAVECGYQRLAEIQEETLWMCEAAHVPVIVGNPGPRVSCQGRSSLTV